MYNNNDFLGEYMVECPKCGHRYNKKLHGNKCPDCGYRKGVAKYIPYAIVLFFIALLFIGPQVTDYFEKFMYSISHSEIWNNANNFLSIVNPVYILIAINIVLFLCGFNQNKADVYGNSYQDTIRYREYYRLLTSGFAHSGIIHIVCNMFSLYNIGTFVYYKVGALLFLLIYFVSLLLGGLLSVYIHHKFDEDNIYSIGASGAICGILGFYLVYIIKLSIDPSQSIEYIYKAVLPLFITIFNPKVDNFGHLSGLIVGIILSFILVNNLSYASVTSNNEINQTILTNRETKEAVKVIIYDDRFTGDIIEYTIYIENEDILKEVVNECMQDLANQIRVNGESISIQGSIINKVAYTKENIIIGEENIMDADELKEFLLFGDNGNPVVTFSIKYSGYNNGEYFERIFYNGIEQ